jgi:hypothetical protein
MEEIVKNLNMTNLKIIALEIHIGMENDALDIKIQEKTQNVKMGTIGSILVKHVLFNNLLTFVEVAKDEMNLFESNIFYWIIILYYKY